MPWFTSSSGKIELRLTKDQAHTGYHQGDCAESVEYLRTIPQVEQQLAKLDPKLVREELCVYGAWDEDELADHEANLNRLLWLACGNIVDQSA